MALTRRCFDILRAEWPAIGLVAGAVLALALFRTLLRASVAPTVVGWSTFAGTLWSEFSQNLVAAAVMFSIVQPVRHFAPRQGGRRLAVVAVALVVAALAVAAARSFGLLQLGQASLVELRLQWPIFFFRFLLVGVMVVAVGEFHLRQVLSLEAMRAAEADRAVLEQEALQARLRTLEAQVEPHFLFNVLANLRRLYQTDFGAGDAMFRRLMAYLAEALPSMREQRPTLARELRLVEAYLELQKVRMGRRLSYRVAIDPALGAVEVPPMMLLTLVENAVKHGLAPLPEGGTVAIGARLDDGQLRIDVADDGRGFSSDASGGGTGLANIRARLAAMFGASAGLSLSATAPRGLRAVVRIPLPAGGATA